MKTKTRGTIRMIREKRYGYYRFDRLQSEI
jgi:hypothetical protein